jgi:tetratricopeptide (TPR) repeat protein
MPGPYDLSFYPDSRFMKFRHSYTTQEHLLSLFESNEALRGQVGAMSSEVGMEMSNARWAIEGGFASLSADLSRALASLEFTIEDGFQGLRESFSWGLARICWQMEQDREVYRDILHTLQTPLATVALELRKRAETALMNGWWEDAVDDLSESLQNNRYDYLAHLQLGRVLWFQYGHWQPAMEQFELAARYGDAANAGQAQRYYAALALIHMSLLWRMDGSEEALRQALSACARAWELVPDVDAVIIEYVLLLCLHRQDDRVDAVLRRAFLSRENRVTAYPRHPDLSDQPSVTAARDKWMSRYSPLLDEAQAVHARARSLCETFGFRQGSAPRPHAARPRESTPPLLADVEAALAHGTEALQQRRRDADSKAGAASSEVAAIRHARPVSRAFHDFNDTLLLTEVFSWDDLGCTLGLLLTLPIWLPVNLAWALVNGAMSRSRYHRQTADWLVQLSTAEAAEQAAHAAREQPRATTQRFEQEAQPLREAAKRIMASIASDGASAAQKGSPEPLSPPGSIA